MKKKAELEIQQFPDAFDIEAIRRCTTIGEFDDAYIAPIYGFEDKVDYYRKNGSKWYLNKIRVPVIAINARDDPFIEESSLPTMEEHVGDLAPVRLIYHDHGGHCGFVPRARHPSLERIQSVNKMSQLQTSASTPNSNNNGVYDFDMNAELDTVCTESLDSADLAILRGEKYNGDWIGVELSRVLAHIHFNTEAITPSTNLKNSKATDTKSSFTSAMAGGISALRDSLNNINNNQNKKTTSGGYGTIRELTPVFEPSSSQVSTNVDSLSPTNNDQVSPTLRRWTENHGDDIKA